MSLLLCEFICLNAYANAREDKESVVSSTRKKIFIALSEFVSWQFYSLNLCLLFEIFLQGIIGKDLLETLGKQEIYSFYAEIQKICYFNYEWTARRFISNLFD